MVQTRLTEDDVRYILTSTESLKTVAARLNCNRATIGYVRTGKILRHVLPELPRRQVRRSCRECQHWRTDESCDLGFPDPLLEGTWFATDCVNYRRS